MIPHVVANALCVAAGQLYPAYSSYKAIKNENSAQYHRWLTYWIVNAFVSGGLLLSDTFLWWLPFYNEAKITCYLWLASPYTEGSTRMYRILVQPLLDEHAAAIDRSLGAHAITDDADDGFFEGWFDARAAQAQDGEIQRLEDEIRTQRKRLAEKEALLAGLRGQQLNDPATALIAWVRGFASR